MDKIFIALSCKLEQCAVCQREKLIVPLALPVLEEVAAAVNGELLKEGRVCCGTLVAPPAGRPAVLCADWVELEDVALRTDAKGLPANWRRSSDALSDAPPDAWDAGAAAADAPLPPAGAPPSGIPNKSRILGVLFSEDAGSGAVANGFVPPFFSWKF